MTEIKVASSTAAFPCEAAGWLMELLAGIGEPAHPLRIALSGGRTPGPVHREIARRLPNAAGLPVREWFQVDERDVPPDHADSNQRLLRETLFSLEGGAAERFHPIPVHPGDPSATERAFDDLLHRRFPDWPPRFDLVVLGVGEDGHTASLFPGTDWHPTAPGTREPVNRAGPATEPSRPEGVHPEGIHPGANRTFRVETLGAWRHSLSFDTLVSARHAVFLVIGRGKAELVGRLIRGAASQLPAGALIEARSQAGQPTRWLLDPDAAGSLRPKD